MGLYDFNQRDNDDDFPWWAKALLTGMAVALLCGVLAIVKEMGG